VPKATRCKLNDRTIDIDEALTLRARRSRPVFRCLECGEPVRAHKKGTTHQAAHFEHRTANPRCPLSTGP
jgi:hypothetical protein